MRKHLLFLIVSIIIISCNYNDEGIRSNNEYETNDLNYTRENFKEYSENPFIDVSEQPISTFSIDADGASYAYMRKNINLNNTPTPNSVRIEEFINYFTYNYSEPKGGENVALNSELSTCPWNPEHHLLRIGIKGKTIPESEIPNSNYVFLIDVSGSMNSPDKLDLLKNGFFTMVDNLDNDDKIAIVTYAGNSNILLESTLVSEKSKIKDAIQSLGSGGSTGGYEGIQTAYKIAEDNYIPEGNNRIILGTDGDFNVGPSSTEELIELIKDERDIGIYLTVLGVGIGNLNDYLMEQVANNGNGNYEYIDSETQIEKVFVHESERFHTIAKDSKIQITFNNNKVKSYRLIGYENRSLENYDFENDLKDAGEIGSGQTITAIYEVILNESNSQENFAQFDFRYKKPNTTTSRLISHNIDHQPINIEKSTENMKFSTAVTCFGLILRESQYKGSSTKQMVINLASKSTNFDNYGYKAEFIELVNKSN